MVCKQVDSRYGKTQMSIKMSKMLVKNKLDVGHRESTVKNTMSKISFAKQAKKTCRQTIGKPTFRQSHLSSKQSFVKPTKKSRFIKHLSRLSSITLPHPSQIHPHNFQSLSASFCITSSHLPHSSASLLFSFRIHPHHFQSLSAFIRLSSGRALEERKSLEGHGSAMKDKRKKANGSLGRTWNGYEGKRRSLGKHRLI